MGTTKTLSISLPAADLRVAQRLAKTTNRSLSGVVREGLKRLAADDYWQRVQAAARPKAESLGLTEDDVLGVIQDYRREKRAKTTKNTAR